MVKRCLSLFALIGAFGLCAPVLPQTQINLATQVKGTLPVANGGTSATTSTGAGAVVLATSPVLTTPNLGTPSAINLANAANLPAASITGTVPASNLPGFGTSASGIVSASGGGTTNFLRADGTWNPATVYPGSGIANSTGSAWGTSYATSGTGSVALTTNPVFTTPNLGTPSAATLTNATGLSLITGITGTLGVGNGGTGTTTSTGTGSAVLGTSPALTMPAYSTAATVTAGTNAQGQGALTNDNNIVTTTAASPSGNTLPTAVAGVRIRVVNAGTNPINLYPAGGAAIDSLGTNAAQQIAVGGVLDLQAASSTQWYSALHTASPQVSTFTSGGSFTAPSGARTVDVYCVGGGGGGGSGARYATTSARFGGGGGGGGSIAWGRITAPTSAISYGVGAAGSGGASVTVDTTNGNPGTAGGVTAVYISATYFCRATGGNLGAGGTATTGTAGVAGSASMFNGGAGGAGTSTTGASASTNYMIGGGGGGAGAAASSTTTASGGASSGTNSAAGGTGGGNGTAGVALTTLGGGTILVAGGSGGGGGSYITASATGAGGAGGAYGGAGGGGAASDNGSASGAGGAGATGAVIFVTSF